MQDGSEKTRAIRRSTLIGIIIFAVFGILLIRILIIQTVEFDKYQKKVIEQMTTESPVPANRGKIYDRNGNILATNITTYRVMVDPSSIKNAEEENNSKYAEDIAKGLSELLDDVTYDFVYGQIKEFSNQKDRTIARKVYEEDAREIRKFISDHSLETMVYVLAQNTRNNLVSNHVNP